ncbi:drug exporter of the RND superfamily-like protein [Streptosporangium roseum DSM 43021]|uniref:Drug exporter of the RND superfamily-like protein n=1 Tax=Streptosporangium roseum (strain ATCC 12428 / DSM 43021 / JCM 3005 / KCTC 9067 / NCIMB 10171 / NRRL 2505 / NI 9100) TaxID=479432 RepID=D2B6E6_STRRD|nr:drug exporter of the RND superfamily-like protein [Streptosporangium roseum DSM 43021]
MRAVAAPPAPPPLRRLGHLLVRRRRLVMVVSLLATLAMAVLAAGAVGGLSLARFEAPGSESDRAGAELAERFGTGSADLILLVTARGGDVNTPAVAAAGQALTRELAASGGVAEAASYWTRGRPATLRSEDGRHALVVARIPGDADAVRSRILPELVPRLTRGNEVISVRSGGGEEVFRQTVPQARQDFVRAEMVIFPLVFVLLWLFLRRAVAALLPILVGVFAMVTTLALLRGALLFTDISTFALNLTLAMGLGLGVDYSLFVISRFREEVARGHDLHEAVARSVERAGRTVIFSGVTVAASVAVLLALPFDFLRSFAYAGIAVVAGGVIGAVIVLPAILAAVGRRVLPKRDRGERAEGFWHALATRVMRRPVVYGGAAALALLVLGSPFLGLRFGVADDRILPASAPARQTQEVIRAGFPAEETDALQIVSTGPAVDVAGYATTLSRLPGVAQVDSAAGSFAAGRRIGDGDPARFAGAEGTWLSVVPSAELMEADPVRLVEQVRAVPAPFGVLVGGYPAELADYRTSVVDRLPLLLAVMFAVTFVILFLMTGSVLIPLKATVLNLLSLSVMFGALVWVYQDGNLSGLLGFTPTGSLDPSIPILMFCIAYGLSMDYEVFVLSRIREEYGRTGDTPSAVAAGLQRSAPLITAAGAILALSFAVYASAQVLFVQMLGVGMAVAILVDATVIRAILVPAFMRLAGPANWWAPAPLRRLHDRLGLSD